MKYNISLDIGNTSVGFCVVDDNGKLLKYHRKNMWGVRLFSEASTAEACRIKRSMRRRYVRRRTRILELRKIMAEMIHEVDADFFARLDESFLVGEDKNMANSKYILFADDKYTDKTYYEKFKTIYHLRNYLINTEEKADPRMIYLAIHHILKYRGNFLYQGQTLDAISDVKMLFEQLFDTLNEQFGEQHGYTDGTFVEIENILKKEEKKKEKKEVLEPAFENCGLDKKVSKEIINAILGYKFNLSCIMKDANLCDENGKALNVAFSDANFEEKEEELKRNLEEKYSIVESLHGIYSWYVLFNILKGKKYLSEAMVEKYQRHREELKQLKRLFDTYAPKEKKKFFDIEAYEYDKNKNRKYVFNYANYIRGMKRCGKTLQESKKNLYNEIDKIIGKKAENDAEYIQIKEKMEQFDFLNKQHEVSNAYIPYQLNENELRLILKNQKKYYPSLAQNEEKIVKMLTCRIPYYIGPLNSYKGERAFAWSQKKNGMEKEKVYPWNVEEVIDTDITAERFITNMTKYCTYLPKEKVLPKHSLLYEKYEVLSELCSISINERKLGKKDRDQIIKELFENKTKVTDAQLKDWAVRERFAGVSSKKEVVIKGYQKEEQFASSLSSKIKFKNIFGKVDVSNEDMIEDMIYWLTVFQEKSIVKRKIMQTYNDRVSEQQLNQILKLNFEGWGRFSRKFLNGIKGDKGTTIIQMMENPDERFLGLAHLEQIKVKDETIKERIEKERKKYDGTENLTDVINDLPASPGVKRGIHQSMGVIDEIIEVMGEKPQQIFIEFARGEGEKERTKTRKQRIERYLKKLKSDCKEEYNKKINDDLKKYESSLDKEKIYLYFMQNGKSLYTQKSISIENIVSECEVDHIIPQTLIDDDSLDNKALVLKSENQLKANRLVLDTNFDSVLNKKASLDRDAYWRKLYDVGMISEKKYANLHKRGVADIVNRGFINRQLVETRQIVKLVANLIQDYYQDKIHVVEVKAELGSAVRKKYSVEKREENTPYWKKKNSGFVFYKNRELNNYHHAHDAYLAAVIGLFIQKRYPKLRKEMDYSGYIKMYKSYYEKYKNERKNMFYAILSKIDENVVDKETGEIIWEGEKLVPYINKIFNYRDYFVSRKIEEETGAFYNETIYPKPDGQEKNKLIPLKKGLNPEKYGGYKGGEKAYYSLIKNMSQKKTKLQFVEIPVYIAREISAGKLTLLEYMHNNLGIEKLEICRNKIQKYQLIELEDGNQYYMVSANEIINAKELVLGGKNQKFNRLIYHMDNETWDKIEPEELKKDMEELYLFLQGKIEKEYSGFSSTLKKIVDTEGYYELDTQERVTFLMELLKLTKASSDYPNMKSLKVKGLSDRMGRKKSIPMKNKITFIDKSIAGLHERRTCYELENGSDKKSR